MEIKLRPHRVWTGFLSCGEASTLLFQSHQRGSERQRERGKSECVAIFKKGWERRTWKLKSSSQACKQESKLWERGGTKTNSEGNPVQQDEHA